MIDWICRHLGRLCYVSPMDLRRLAPFFGVYLVLFSALTLADGMSLALFVSRVGADALPRYYGLTAMLSLLVVWGYMRIVQRRPSVWVFQAILLGCLGVFAVAWAATTWLPGDVSAWYGLFFVAREVAFVLVLAHFGTYLQDYFTRAELNRVLPIIYAGGRFGGLAGGAMLEHLSPLLGVPQLTGVFAALILLALFSLRRMARSIPVVDDESATVVNQTVPESEGGFGKLFFGSPLFRWFAVTSVLFMLVRWFLNYQYNHYFETHFASEAELASFLGWYTQWALLISLVAQLLLVNRLVAVAGIKGAHALSSTLLLLGMGWTLWPMTLTIAVASRMLETELRYGLRNPVNQLVTNLFPKATRVRVRAWTLGALNPLAALFACGMLQGLQGTDLTGWVAPLGVALALAHAAASLALYGAFREEAPFWKWVARLARRGRQVEPEPEVVPGDGSRRAARGEPTKPSQSRAGRA